MVDRGRTRRRHHSSTNAAVSSALAATENDKDKERFRTEIRSGGSSDTEDDEDKNDQSHQHDNKDKDRNTHRPKHRTKKRKRRRRRDDDPPFFVLFFQVGAVLLMLCLASFHVCSYVFPSVLKSSTSGTAGADDDRYYVGDDLAVDAIDQPQTVPENGDDGNYGDNSEYRHDQELKLNELLHSTKDDYDTKPPKKRDGRDKKETSEATTTEKAQNKTIPPLPTFNLSDSAHWDAFGILDRLEKRDNENDKDFDTDNDRNNQPAKDSESFWNMARGFRMRFAELYGGENAARMLLDRGLTTFPDNISATVVSTSEPPSDVVSTACRLHRARSEHRPFRMAFGGYSVTAGRGNKHRDSYPFQLKELLEPILEAAGFGSKLASASKSESVTAFAYSPLSVTNAAIGGVPSFPYGWCMAEFWGGVRNQARKQDTDTPGIPDVVSWDFGMNEASGGPEGLEAYVRHLISTYSTATSTAPTPKLIVKDSFTTAGHRTKVLAAYASILKDPVVLHTDHAVAPIFDATKTSLIGKINGDGDDEDVRRPPGFRKWREWGAPKGAPGQASHHPAVQEHKLNGWILAMHFVAALEYMVAMDEKEHTTTETSPLWCPAQTLSEDRSGTKPLASSPSFLLPPPVSRTIANDTTLPYDGIFFGYPLGGVEQRHDESHTAATATATASWAMNPIRCRTTFEPKYSGDLSAIVVSGTMGEDLDPTLPKSQYYYNQGWTYDFSEAEKSAKRKLNLYPDGLGFRDSKEAYYGIYESPPVTLLLPYENDLPLLPQPGDPAANWYESIVLCQVNDKNTFDSAFADPNTCNFATDVGIRIGGFNVTLNTTKMLNTIGSVYLGKPICKHVAIPPLAKLTSHNTLLKEGDRSGNGSGNVNGVMAGDGISIDSRLLEIDETGLLVEVFVSNPHIVHVDQACSLSHVIWEEARIGSSRKTRDTLI